MTGPKKFHFRHPSRPVRGPVPGNLTGRYQPAPGPGKLEGVVFTLDERGAGAQTRSG